MANNEDKLSRLYREGLENFAKDPPPQVWAGIKQGLLIKNLVTLKFLTSLNIYSVTVLVTAAAVAGIFTGKQMQLNDNVADTGKAASTIVTDKHAKTNEIKAEQKIQYEKAVEETTNNTEYDTKIQNQPANAITKKNETEKKQGPTNNKQQVKKSLNNNDNVSKPDEAAIDMTVKTEYIQKEVNPEHSVFPEEQTNKDDKAIDKQKEEKEKIQSEQVKEITIPKKPKTGQGFYAEIFGAPSLIKYKFEESDVNPNLTFVEASKQNEEPALSYTAGLELGYGFKHLFAQTGINYSDYRSKTVIDLVSTSSFWEINLELDSVYVPDSMNPHYDYFYDTLRVLTTQDTHVYHNADNSMRYLEIPIILGYRFYKDKFSYAIAGGVSFGYLTSSGGKTLNPDLKSVTSNTSESVPYKPWTIYLLFRAEGAYLLKNNLSIFVRPGFKYNLSSVFEDYYPVQKSFYALDLHLGLRYNF